MTKKAATYEPSVQLHMIEGQEKGPFVSDFGPDSPVICCALPLDQEIDEFLESVLSEGGLWFVDSSEQIEPAWVPNLLDCFVELASSDRYKGKTFICIAVRTIAIDPQVYYYLQTVLKPLVWFHLGYPMYMDQVENSYALTGPEFREGQKLIRWVQEELNTFWKNFMGGLQPVQLFQSHKSLCRQYSFINEGGIKAWYEEFFNHVSYATRIQKGSTICLDDARVECKITAGLRQRVIDNGLASHIEGGCGNLYMLLDDVYLASYSMAAPFMAGDEKGETLLWSSEPCSTWYLAQSVGNVWLDCEFSLTRGTGLKKVMLHKGSMVTSPDDPACSDKIRELKKTMVKEGRLSDHGTGATLTDDVAFERQSDAAAFIAGNLSAGRTLWRKKWKVALR